MIDHYQDKSTPIPHKTTYGSSCNIEVLKYTPRPLTIFLDPKIATYQLLGPDPRGVWEFTNKISDNFTLGNGPFCKKCVFALKMGASLKALDTKLKCHACTLIVIRATLKGLLAPQVL